MANEPMRKDAGIVTAYGAAVRGGYTGTYEDFCRQQANYAEYAQDVEEAKTAAVAAAGAASTSETNAGQNAGAAAQSATAAGQSKTAAESAAGRAEAAMESYAEMTASAETLPAGSPATAELDRTGDHPVLVLGLPEGDQGDPGVSPTVTVTDITGGHRVTITDAEGDHTFDVMNGIDGTGAVDSVNGKTGPVVLDGRDINVNNSESNPETIEEALGDVNRALNDKIDTSIIAEEYDSTATYAVGDYCIYEGVLYKCNTAIATAEAWTAAHWTATAVMLETGSGGGTVGAIIQLESDNETAPLGEEIASGSGWTLGAGWSGDFANGFTHSSGTDALEFSVPNIAIGKMYVVQFNSSVVATDTNILISIGDSDTFPLYGMPEPYKVGIVSKSTANLKFIPESSYAGTISNISIKEVTDVSVAYMKILDTNSQASLHFRTGQMPLNNVFIGLNAGQYNVTGYGNVAVGNNALANVIGGFWNTAVGLSALKDNTTGSRNIGIGYGALMANLSGHRNIGIGTFALINNITGYHNVAVGSDCMNDNTSGYENIGIGFQALYHNTTGERNIGIGKGAGANITTGSRNVAIGANALPQTTTGNNNLAIGYGVMPTTNGSGNVAIGFGALYKNTNGNYNVAIGQNAGQGSNNASQEKNVFVGVESGNNIYNSVTKNTFVGYRAGYTLVKGSNNVCIGSEADVPTSQTSNFTNINNQIMGSKESGSEWTQVLGDLIIMGTDGVKRQIVFNQDNTISWTVVT